MDASWWGKGVAIAKALVRHNAINHIVVKTIVEMVNLNYGEGEMVGKLILSWMDEHERTPGYLCRKSGLTLDEIIDLITGAVVPTDTALEALAEATGLPPDQLQANAADLAVSEREPDPLHCLTVKQVAELLQVSPDTVRAEMDSGALGSITFGQRVKRIPREALERRLATCRGAGGGEQGWH